MVETGKYFKPRRSLSQFLSEVWENSQWRNFFFAFGISIVLYFYLDGLVTETREKVISFQLIIEDVHIQTNFQKQPIQLRIKGAKEAFNRLEIQPILKKITTADLEGKIVHQKKISIAELLKLPNDFQILNISPEIITVELIKIDTQMAKVIVDLDVINLKTNYKVMEVTHNPPFIKLTGPSIELEKIKTVQTEKIVLDENIHLGQHSFIVQPIVPKNIQCNTVEVKINIVEEITKICQVEVALLILPPGLKHAIKKIDLIEVQLKGPDYLLRAIREDQKLKAYVDLTDINEEYESQILASGGAIKKRVKFLDLPENITKPSDLEINVEFLPFK